MTRNEKKRLDRIHLKKAAYRIWALITRDCSVPYSCKRGAHVFENGIPVSWKSELSGWLRVKETGGSEPRDRFLGVGDVTEHLRGRADYAVQLPDQTDLFCIDLDLHPKKIGRHIYNNGGYDRMHTRLMEVAYNTVRWITLSGAAPLVMYSPGKGFHIWGRVDRIMESETLVTALKADYTEYMAEMGVKPLGDGQGDIGVGTDWYPTRRHIRVPGGRGQLILDPDSLRPDSRFGSVDKGGKRRRKLIISAHEIITRLNTPFTVGTDGRRTIGESEMAENPLLARKSTGLLEWELTCERVRYREALRNGFQPPEPKELPARRRWEGTTLFDSTGPKWGLPVKAVKPEKEIREWVFNPEPSQEIEAGPVQLPEEIHRGASFRALMEAAESQGIKFSGSTSEYSAARKLAWRARSRGIGTDGLDTYLDQVIEKSDLSKDGIKKLKHEAILAHQDFVHIQPMSSAFRNLAKSDDQQKSDQSIQSIQSNRLDSKPPPTPTPSTLPESLEYIPSLRDVTQSAASVLMALTQGDLNTAEISEVCKGKRVKGTRKRVATVIKRGLKGHQFITMIRPYIKGKYTALWRLTTAGWGQILAAQFMSPEIKMVDISIVPEEMRKDVRVHIYRLGAGSALEPAERVEHPKPRLESGLDKRGIFGMVEWIETQRAPP